MARSLVLGNGHTLVAEDKFGQVSDLYFHYIGLENHVSGHSHRLGVFVDGRFSWLNDGRWQLKIDYQKETMVGRIKAENTSLGLRFEIEDVVYNEKNIFLRHLRLFNLDDKPRQVKVFFSQEFQISGTSKGNTAFFEPQNKVIIHYKGRRVFLVNCWVEGKGFDDYTTGICHFSGKEGSFKDAEDGVLAKNPAEHGSVDSTISVSLELTSKGGKEFFYWIAAGKGLEEVWELNSFILQKTPAYIVESTQDFWQAWLKEQDFNFFDLSDEVIDLFKKSLLIIRTHVDNTGPILASGDGQMLQYGKDSYCYTWPRDASFAAMALDKTGYSSLAEKFFSFCNEVIMKEGYLMHKYLPDRSLGSSWHPWVEDGRPQLPIQEDETALVLWALWYHYQAHRDLEFIESIYNSLIKRAADFLVSYRGEDGLPRPSYDLWEEKLGIFTFTAAAVYGGLVSACRFATLLGKEEEASRYQQTAVEVKKAIESKLYDQDKGIFLKGFVKKEEQWVSDLTIDASSFWGVLEFGVLDPFDARMKRFAKIIEATLGSSLPDGGVARYENDSYLRKDPRVSGNPWFISYLWLSKFYIETAKNKEELVEAKNVFEWVADHALPSGILSEQLDPYTGEQISVSPLVWSQAAFVLAVIDYLQKLSEFEEESEKGKFWKVLGTKKI